MTIVKVIPQRPDPVVSTQSTKFGEDRARRYQQRLQTLIKQNQALIGAINVTNDPLQSNIALKQTMIVSEIDRLQNKQKDEVVS